MTSRYDPSSSQYKDIFHLSPVPLSKSPNKSPETRPIKMSSDFPLFEILRENGLLENAQKVKIMTKEYLIHYILNIFEGYIKQKDPPMTPAAYFLKYLETKKPGTSSLRKIANSVAHSLGCYLQKSQEVNFFYEVFSQRKPVLKMIQNYLYCRRVVKTYFQTKEILDDIKLSLHLWTTIVRKIFKDKPGDLIVEKLKEKIANNNKQKAFDKISIEPYQRDSSINFINQASNLEIEAIYFIILCLGEFQAPQTSFTPFTKSPQTLSPNRSHTNITPTRHYRHASDTVRINPAKVVVRNDVPIILIEDQVPKFTYSPNFDIYKKKATMSRDESREYSLYTYNGRDISPNRSVLTTSSNWQMRPDKGLDVSREGFYKGKSESQSVLNTSLIVRPKELSKEESVLYEQLYQERITLKREVALQTTEKRISLETLLKTIDFYEDLAKDNVTVSSFLKQMQKDFSVLLSKLKTTEPYIFRDIDKTFVERFLLNKPKELTLEKTKVISNIKHRFDPKAAYRQVSQRASTKEEPQPTENPEISLDDFRAQVFTPGSKAYIASQKENIQRIKEKEEKNPNHLSFENNRKYNPALLDDTQKLLMSLYGNTANIQKKNGVELEKKGLREIEQERAKPEANGEVKKKASAANPKYINYQAISERPKTSVLPQESPVKKDPVQSTTVPKRNAPEAEKSEIKAQTPEKVAKPIITENIPNSNTKEKDLALKTDTSIKKELPKEETKTQEIAFERKPEVKEKEKRVAKVPSEKEASPKMTNKTPVVEKVEEIKQNQPTTTKEENKKDIKEETKPQIQPGKPSTVEKTPVKAERVPEKTLTPVSEAKQEPIKQPTPQKQENTAQIKEQNNPQSNNSVQKQQQPTEAPTSSLTKTQKPVISEPKLPKPEQNVTVAQKPVLTKVEKVEPKPEIKAESTGKIQNQGKSPLLPTNSSHTRPPIETKPLLIPSQTQAQPPKIEIKTFTIPSTLLQKPAPSKPVSLPAGAVPIGGELPLPPQIKVSLGIQIVMGNKFEQIIAEKPELAALHKEILQQQSEKKQQRQKQQRTVVSQPQKQIQEPVSKPAQVQQIQGTLIRGELPPPPQIKGALGIKVVMGAKFDQVIAQDPAVAALHQQILQRKPQRETKPLTVTTSQATTQIQGNKPAQTDSSNLNIIRGELPPPPKINITLGIKVVMGVKFDQVIAQDPTIAALHQQILQRPPLSKQIQNIPVPQAQANVTRPSQVQSQSSNQNLVMGELLPPPAIKIALGIKIVMGAKFDQVIAQDPAIAALHQQILQRPPLSKQARNIPAPQNQSNSSRPPQSQAQSQSSNQNIVTGELSSPPAIKIALGIKVVMGAKFDQVIAQDPAIAALHQQILQRKPVRNQKPVSSAQQTQARQSAQSTTNIQGNNNIITDDLPAPPQLKVPLGIKVVMGNKFDQLIAQDPAIASLHEQILKRNSEKKKEATIRATNPVQTQPQQTSSVSTGNSNMIKGELPPPPKVNVPLGIKVVMGVKFDQLIAQDPTVAALHQQILQRPPLSKQVQNIPAPQTQVNNTGPSQTQSQSSNQNLVIGELPPPPAITIALGIKIVMGVKFDQVIQDPTITALHQQILQRPPKREQIKALQPTQASTQAPKQSNTQASDGNLIKGELPPPPVIIIALGIKIVMGVKFDQVIQDPAIAALHQQILERKPLREQIKAPSSQSQPQAQIPKPSQNDKPGINLIKDELPSPPKITLVPAIDLVRPGLSAQAKPKVQPTEEAKEAKIEEPKPKVEEKKPEAAPSTTTDNTEAKPDPPKVGKFSGPKFKPPVFKKKET